MQGVAAKNDAAYDRSRARASVTGQNERLKLAAAAVQGRIPIVNTCAVRRSVVCARVHLCGARALRERRTIGEVLEIGGGEVRWTGGTASPGRVAA
jgi:hypothetical protein